MINKSPVRVGGSSALDTSTNLPMFRKYITFEGNRENEYIHVQYEQWLEANGIAINKLAKSYLVKDIAEVTHEEEGVVIVDSPMIPMFSEGWLKRKIKATSQGLMVDSVVIAPLDTELNFGEDLIVGAINATLVAMPFDAVNGYIVTP